MPSEFASVDVLATIKDFYHQLEVIEAEGREPAEVILGLSEEWAIRCASRVYVPLMSQDIAIDGHCLKMTRTNRAQLRVLPKDFRGFGQGKVRG